MNTSSHDIIKAKNELLDLVKNSSLKDYVYGVGISMLRIMQETQNTEYDLGENETLNDYCLVLYCLKALPEESVIMEHLKNIKIVYVFGFSDYKTEREIGALLFVKTRG